MIAIKPGEMIDSQTLLAALAAKCLVSKGE